MKKGIRRLDQLAAFCTFGQRLLGSVLQEMRYPADDAGLSPIT